MIQVLEEPQSFGQAFASNLMGGLSRGVISEIENAQKMKQETAQNRRFGDVARKLTGREDVDWESIPEKQRSSALSQAMREKAKLDQQERDENYLNQLFGGNIQDKKQPKGILKPEFEQPEEEQFDITNIPPETIIKASARKPNVARAVGHLQDVERREKTAKEKFDYEKEQDVKKEIANSYKENKDYMNKVYDAYEEAQRKEKIYDRMDQLEESGELSDSGIINLLKTIGLPEEFLMNPENEEYTKLALDTLGGGSLQSDYGNRILASEFKVSLQRIPTLSQTPEGRKQIKENLRAMLLPAKLKEERLRYYEKKSELEGKPLPHNLRGKVLQDIKPQLDQAALEFKQRNGRYKVKPGTFPDDDVVQKYYSLSQGDDDKAAKMMREDGYDVE